MIEVRYHREFIKEFNQLPLAQKKKLAHLEGVFRNSPFDSRLHGKKLSGKLAEYFSFRVTRDYRVIFRLVSIGFADFISVRHRKEIYR